MKAFLSWHTSHLACGGLDVPLALRAWARDCDLRLLTWQWTRLCGLYWPHETARKCVGGWSLHLSILMWAAPWCAPSGDKTAALGPWICCPAVHLSHQPATTSWDIVTCPYFAWKWESFMNFSYIHQLCSDTFLYSVVTFYLQIFCIKIPQSNRHFF